MEDSRQWFDAGRMGVYNEAVSVPPHEAKGAPVMSREGRSSRNRVSVLSWMWTIVLACIPGVNIIAMFLLAFLAKRQPKRTFAIASLWLMLIVAVLIFAAFLFFPAEMLSFGEWLRDFVPLQGTGTPLEL